MYTKIRFSLQYISLIFFCISVFMLWQQKDDIFKTTKESVVPEKALATGQYAPTGSSLIAGTASTTSFVNVGNYKGTLGNDSNYWSFRRNGAAGFDAQLYFDNTKLYSANKILITMESANITTANAYVHQICDWVSSTGVDNAADAQCTGGGWRTLEPQRTNLTDTTDITRVYEIYDGYFSTRVTTPGTIISTPLSNFANTSNGRVIIRSYSTVNSAVEHRIDFAQVEVAIDPIYEPSGFATTSAGVTTNFISDLVGGNYTTVTGSDGTKFTVPMTAVSTAADFYFSFKNVQTYTGMNTILVSAEICKSNASLTFGMYLYNFQNSTWTSSASSTVTADVCATDRDEVFAFNSTTIGGFNLDDHISSSGEIRLRFLTNAPGTVYNLQFDRMYLMLGSVNADSTKCEISWGTGTAANCANTRSIGEGITNTPTTATWQVTSAIEYPSTYYALDNDDDTTNAEYAYSSNVSFPITVASSTSITGIHYATKFRSNVTTITNDIQLKNYAGTSGVSGEATGSGWQSTPGTDSNALTTYNYFDTMRIIEQQNGPDDFVDTANNLMNMRIRTSISTNVAGGVSNDIDFAMMSIRWINEQSRVTLTSQYAPTGSSLIAGTASTTSFVNVGNYKGTLGNDSNYWSFRRNGAAGFDAQLYFDNTKLYSANKILITMESANITTANAYVHQICDWVSSTGVDNAADAQCTGGGWRTLEPQRTNLTDTTDITRVYEIYDGYFSTRVTTPGTIISTPLSNFANTSNGRVIIRSYSTVNSAVEHRIDFAQVEVAIDPIYEPSGFATTSAGVTTNFISDLVGGNYTTVTGSDGTKFTVPMTAVSTAADFYFSFKNVQTYTGMNTILVSAEICKSNASLTFGMYLYNFQNSTWTSSASSTVTADVCATDRDEVFAFNSTTIGGFNLDDHISSSGEIRLRFLTNAPGTVYNLQFDRMYLMLGSVNADSTKCEISWGTGTAANCANTRSIGEGITNTPTTATWQVTSAIEYPSTYYALDNDDDTTNAEYAYSSNVSFPITVASSTSITGIHYATKFRSNVTTITNDIQLKNYAGTSGVSGEATGSGWQSTPGTDSNALTTYNYFDTMRIIEQQNGPDDFVDTANNLMNMRIRTSISTNVAGGVSNDIDFAMMSVRYLKKQPAQYITLSISDNTIGFGQLSSVGVRYATGDTLGTTSTTTMAHTISAVTNAPGGYSLTLNGSTLTSGAQTITPIGATATTSRIGFEQFGLRIATSSGNGVTYVPYKTSLWAFDSGAFPDQIATGAGDDSTTVYTLRYIGNIDANTEAGSYTATLNYALTGSY